MTMPPSFNVQNVTQTDGEMSGKKKVKGFVSSLRRLLRLERGSSSDNVGPRGPVTGQSSATGQLSPLSQVQHSSARIDSDSGASRRGPPRSSASMPLLFQPMSPSGNSESAGDSLRIVQVSSRRVHPAPSSSALLQLPPIEAFGPALSSSAMADNVESPFCTTVKAAASTRAQQVEVARHGPLSGSPVASAVTTPATTTVAEDSLTTNRSTSVAHSQPLPLLSRYASEPTSIPLPVVRHATPAATSSLPVTSTLVAMCPGAPAAMRRPVWRLLDYQLESKLYKGEFSSVYKASCQVSGLKVVLKVYSLSRIPENALHTLEREVRIHASLTHSNICTLYGVFEEENRLVLVLERASGGDLFNFHRDLLPTPCRMDEDQLRLLVLAPLLEALGYLHGRGVCHRDIKPENLLLTGSWQLRLADFGAAINLSHERAVTRTGTEDYMAPEVERCPLKLLPQDNKDNRDLAYTTAVDVWSVGVLAYEMLVGFPPFVSAGGGAAAGYPYGGGGGGGIFTTAADKELHFPHFVSAGAQDFISLALTERPMDRPTAGELLRHPWLKHAVRHLKVQQQQPGGQVQGPGGLQQGQQQERRPYGGLQHGQSADGRLKRLVSASGPMLSNPDTTPRNGPR